MIGPDIDHMKIRRTTQACGAEGLAFGSQAREPGAELEALYGSRTGSDGRFAC